MSLSSSSNKIPNILWAQNESEIFLKLDISKNYKIAITDHNNISLISNENNNVDFSFNLSNEVDNEYSSKYVGLYLL